MTNNPRQPLHLAWPADCPFPKMPGSFLTRFRVLYQMHRVALPRWQALRAAWRMV
jgi:hypothetical protein